MTFSRRLKSLWLLASVTAIVSACAGSHTTPTVTPAEQSAVTRPRAAAVLANGDLIAIDAGGPASGSFSADADYLPGSWTYTTTSAISTAGVTSPAPQAVYQSEREGKTISYSIPGLTPSTPYTVRLSFAEVWWKAAGKRVFNVSINGTQVLTNFDEYVAAGGPDTAIAETFPATSSATGTISIVLTAVTDNAAIDAIEILSAGGATPAPSTTPSPGTSASPSPGASATPSPGASPSPGPSVSGLFIHSGGGAAAPFVADEDYVASGTYSSSTTNAISTTGVTNPAPQAVYQSQRTGATISYSIPGFVAGNSYNVRLDFAEKFWTAPGKRVFNIAIDNATVLTGLDIFAAAGGEYKALAESFTTVAPAGGKISIVLTATTNYAVLNGIEITPSGATPSPTSPPTVPPVATPSPAPSSSIAPAAFNDWPTYQYDNQHDGFNPNTSSFTPASLSNLHLAWQVDAGSGYDENQPIIANVPGHAALLIVGSSSGNLAAFDAQTGAKIWSTHLGKQTLTNCGVLGVDGTARYDASTGSVYIAAGNDTVPNEVYLYRLNAASGAITGSVNVTPTLLTGESLGGHTGVTLAGGLAYIGTGSACDNSSWRGRVAAVNVSTMTLANTFFTTWNAGPSPAPYSGGGVWGWGGVAVDGSGNVFTAVGNADTNKIATGGLPQPPFMQTTDEQAGYSENIVKLTSDLSTVLDSNYPVFNFTVGWGDLDFSGTPVIFQPPGCDELVATQGKGGTLVVNDTTKLSPPTAMYTLSKPSAEANYIGNPAYSPNTGLLYAPVASSQGGALYAPGMAAFQTCGTNVAWHATFGPDSFAYSGANPRSAPTVTAGGVVFMGTPCTNNGAGGCGTPGTLNGALWAVDASTGTILGSGKPLLLTSDNIRFAPVVDGLWVWVFDESGHLYGMTIDPTVKAISVARRPRITGRKINWR